MSLDIAEVLVTGGAGFIGSHLVDQLLNDGFKVRILDNLSTGKMENIVQHKNNKNFRFLNGDIRNVKEVIEAIKGVDAIFHQAAQVSVPISIKDPIRFS